MLAIAGVVVLGAIMPILDTTFVAGTIATLLRKFGVSLPTTLWVFMTYMRKGRGERR